MEERKRSEKISTKVSRSRFSLYMIHLIAETEECGMHGKLISSWNIELINGKLGKRSRLDCKSRRELGSTATCLQTWTIFKFMIS